MESGNCILSCFFLWLLLQVKLGAAVDASSDSILFGASLTGNQTRISKNDVFKLGFFSLTRNNVKQWYVGIWYAMSSQQTIAWMANREQPLQNNSGVFNLTENGSLILSYGGSIVWSSKANGMKPSAAVIMNSGNLVVVSAENSSVSIWESFDHPGNTVTQNLTSWKSTWDPSPGPYSFRLDADGTDQQSGAWNCQIFTQVLEMPQNYNYDVSLFDNGSYKYVTYTLKPDFPYLSHFVLHELGEIQVYFVIANNEWNMFWERPGDQCQVYAVCGAYASCHYGNLQSCNCLPGFVPSDMQEWDSQQWSRGCVRKTPLQCSNAENWTNKVGFVELSGKSTPHQWVQYEGQGQGQCRTTCLSNCSCTAYAYISNSTLQACLIWFGELLDLSDAASNGISMFFAIRCL